MPRIHANRTLLGITEDLVEAYDAYMNDGSDEGFDAMMDALEDLALRALDFMEMFCEMAPEAEGDEGQSIDASLH